MPVSLERQVREAAERRILFLPHAVRQMNRPERMIGTDEIRKVVGEGTINEDYPEDVRGRSCLILGFGEGGRPIHVVCAPKEEYLAIITAYVPDEQQWENNFTERKRK